MQPADTVQMVGIDVIDTGVGMSQEFIKEQLLFVQNVQKGATWGVPVH